MRGSVIGLLLGTLAGGFLVPGSIAAQSSEFRTGASTGVALKVAAASELDPAITEVARAFEQKTGNHVQVVFGDSAGLYGQVRKGADFDVLFSTDMSYPRQLAASGAGVATSVKEYARDRLVLSISPMVRVGFPPGNPLLILRDKSLSHVAIADPKHTSSGKASEEGFRAARIYDSALRRKLLIGEDDAQVAQFLKSGDADVALLPMSATRAYGLWGARAIPIAPNLCPPIRMGAVVVTRSSLRGEGLAFLRFATSADGQAIFRRDGF